MAASPLVSVIVPVYNVEKYLRRCLDSLMNQTLGDLEIICVYDRSPDNCPQILEQYASRDKRIKVIQQQGDDVGPAAARNIGLQAAQAPYIGFIDADDSAAPEAFETAVKIMLDDDEIDFVQWGATIYDEATGEIRPKDTEVFNEPIYQNPGKHKVTGEVAIRVSPTVWSRLHKAGLIKNNQLAFPIALYHEDEAFTWQYILHAQYGFFLAKPLINYFKRPESMMGLKWANTAPPFDNLKILKLVFDYYRQHNVSPAQSPRLWHIFERLVYDGYRFTSEPDQFRDMTFEIMKDYGLAPRNFKSLMKFLNRPQGYERPKYTVLEKIASIKNVGPEKVIRLLGLELRFKRRPD